MPPKEGSVAKIRKKGERPSELRKSRGTAVPAAAYAVLVGIAGAGVRIWLRAPLVSLSSAGPPSRYIGNGRPGHPPPWIYCMYVFGVNRPNLPLASPNPTLFLATQVTHEVRASTGWAIIISCISWASIYRGSRRGLAFGSILALFVLFGECDGLFLPPRPPSSDFA